MNATVIVLNSSSFLNTITLKGIGVRRNKIHDYRVYNVLKYINVLKYKFESVEYCIASCNSLVSNSKDLHDFKLHHDVHKLHKCKTLCQA